MTDDMPLNNSYHFIKNYPNIPVICPSEWKTNKYLKSLQNNTYDLLFSNNPCSGLSQINKNANVNQPINDRFFEVFDVIKKLQPKTFLIENAPTLVTIGTPILHKMVKLLGDDYCFTIIRDMAGNHNVPMKRKRTLIVGWNKKYFNSDIPIIKMNKEEEISVKTVLEDVTENLPNMESNDKTEWNNIIKHYDKIPQDSSVIRMCCEHFSDIKDDLNNNQLKTVLTAKAKLEEGKNIWDKSPWRLNENKQCMSMTSVSKFIHPTENRDLYIREYARIMGYPDDFIFYPDECQCSTIQCLAQGVPVNFIKYISSEIKRCLTNYDECFHGGITYQNHVSNTIKNYSIDEFLNLNNLNKGV